MAAKRCCSLLAPALLSTFTAAAGHATATQRRHMSAQSGGSAPGAVRRVGAAAVRAALSQPMPARSVSTVAAEHDASAAPPPPAHAEGHGNYFAFFGFPERPVLDGSVLQKRYHALQLEVHPDKQQEDTPAATVGSADQTKSKTDISVYANGAYETLKDPFLRCRYLSRLERARELKNGSDGKTPAADRAGWVPLTPAEEEALAQEDDKRSERIAEAAPLRPMDDSFMEEVLAMNELIFGGDRENEHVRNQMVVLRRDLEERDDDYFDRAAKKWEEGDYFEFYHLILEWTYVTNALNHVKNRL